MSPESPSKSNAFWKGKGKAVDEDFSDLNPTITYRHILQQNLGIRDPLRVVALCDSDAFYAACEMNRLGVKDKPLIVLQWEGIIAVNYPARARGVSRFQKLKDAKECCPELMIVHVATYKEGESEPGYWDDIDSRTHKVSLDYYRRESSKVFAMMKESLPDAEIERASIDEAFIDFTKPVRQVLLQRYPFLAEAPANAPDGLDTPLPPPPAIDWGSRSNIIPINPEDSNATPSSSTAQHTWHDIALSIAAEMMHATRTNIETKVGYTTSAGISRNKFLAKLCASYKKPNSQVGTHCSTTVLRNDAIPNYLRPMAFQKIRFLGGKLGKALAEEYDVSTVQELLAVSLEEIQAKFGENAIWVYELLRGIDRTEVKEKSVVNKSMLASKNLQKPITKPQDGQHWIRVLAAELALRLNDARKTNPQLWPKTLVLHTSRHYQNTRSKQAPFPFAREVTVDLIASAGNRLWKELVGNAAPIKITNVSLAFTGIEIAEEGQQNIDEFFKAGRVSKRPRETDSVTESEGRIVDGESSSLTGYEGRNTPTFFSCAECDKTFSLPKKFLSPSVSHAEIAQALDTMRNEHNDFHFAQSVAR
ncbi:DNA/RNA polymerase, partial [Dendrothele bispora CBS 962.96]